MQTHASEKVERAPHRRSSQSSTAKPAGVTKSLHVAQLRSHAASLNGSPHVAQLKAQAERTNGSPRVAQLKAPAKRASNRTGLPESLKAGVEALSGMSLDHVRVHYNSTKPAQLNALAYAQGNEIHVGPGQERHLPHEAWHAVQQAQSRVRPTVQLAGIGVNDDVVLEREAETMGRLALAGGSGVAQRMEEGQGEKAGTTNSHGSCSCCKTLQGKFTFRGEVRSRDKDVKYLWELIKKSSSDDIALGDKKILEDFVRSDDDRFPGKDLDIDELMEEIKGKRSLKRKILFSNPNEKPEDYQKRTTRGIGNRVDWETDRHFRIERRIRRRAPLGGRNLYTTSYFLMKDLPDLFPGELAKRKKVKIVTSSQPPGGLPKGSEAYSDELLASLIKVGHSEEQTHDIEQNFPLIKDAPRISEATTREQCKDCRHNFPSTDLSHHFFGYLYSAPEDHIQDTTLRDLVIANQGKKGNQSFTADQQKDFTAAINSATWARQHAKDQNPALEEAYKRIEAQSEDSSDEYSDDEDPIFMSPFLYRRIEGKLTDKRLGKAVVRQIEPKHTLSKTTLKEISKNIEKMRKSAMEAEAAKDNKK